MATGMFSAARALVRASARSKAGSVRGVQGGHA